jgi:hypothetical protein
MVDGHVHPKGPPPVLLLKRLLSVVLVLAGIAATVVGGWFTSRVGTSGTATFTLRPTSAAPVLLEPTLLNRLTAETVVRITPAAGHEVWVGTGGLADTRAAVGSAELVHAEGVDVRDGRILTSTTGTGAAEAVTSADLWRRVERSSTTPITWTIAQSQSPDSLLVVSDRPVSEISVSWTRKSWFFQALVLALLGVIAAGGGLLLLRSTVRGGTRTTEQPDATTTTTDEPEVVR